MLDLAHIRALADAATKAPWEVKVIQPHMDGRCQYRVGPSGPGGFQGLVFPQDAEFIAAARELVPAMADEIERLRRELATLRAHAFYALKNQSKATGLRPQALQLLRDLGGKGEGVRAQ